MASASLEIAPIQNKMASQASRQCSRKPRLLSLSTAVPEYTLVQSDVAAAMLQTHPDIFANSETMAGVFASAGIRTRNSARPLDWYLTPRGWPERSSVYIETAGNLFIEASRKALDAAGCRAEDVDTVVFVSTTGIATPSLEAVVHARMGFRDDVERAPTFGLGCAGGVSGLAIASRLAVVRPGSIVLMVAIELSTLAFRLDAPTRRA